MFGDNDAFDELVRAVAKETGRSEEFCREFISQMAANMRAELESGETVSIEGLGEFHHKKDPEEVVFEPDSELQNLVNAPYAHMEPEVIDNIDQEPEPDTDKPPAKASPNDSPQMTSEAREVPAEEATPHEPSISFKNKYRREQPSQSHLWILAAAFIILLIAAGAWYMLGILPDSGSEPTDLVTSETTRQSQAEQDTQGVSETAVDTQASGRQTKASEGGNESDQGSQDQTGTASTTQGKKVRTVTVTAGQSLWGLADNEYQNPYLWPWIYDTNREDIEDPDIIYVGQALDLPVRSGENERLSDNDSLQVALAYVETYRWYKENNLANAKFYLYAAVKYHERIFAYTDGEIDEADKKFANRAR